MQKIYGNKQRGASLLGIIIFLVIFLFDVYIGLKLAPAYWDNFLLKDAMNKVVKEGKARSQFDFIVALQKRLNLNNVRDVPYRQLRVRRENGVLTARLQYETREKIIANADVVLKFDDAVRME